MQRPLSCLSGETDSAVRIEGFLCGFYSLDAVVHLEPLGWETVCIGAQIRIEPKMFLGPCPLNNFPCTITADVWSSPEVRTRAELKGSVDQDLRSLCGHHREETAFLQGLELEERPPPARGSVAVAARRRNRWKPPLLPFCRLLPQDCRLAEVARTHLSNKCASTNAVHEYNNMLYGVLPATCTVVALWHKHVPYFKLINKVPCAVLHN